MGDTIKAMTEAAPGRVIALSFFWTPATDLRSVCNTLHRPKRACSIPFNFWRHAL